MALTSHCTTCRQRHAFRICVQDRRRLALPVVFVVVTEAAIDDESHEEALRLPRLYNGI